MRASISFQFCLATLLTVGTLACGDADDSGGWDATSGVDSTGSTQSDTEGTSSQGSTSASTETATESTTGDGDGDSTGSTSDTTSTSTTGVDPDNHPPSQDPPGGLDPASVPVFVSLGWDDNAYSGLEGTPGGMNWARSIFDARTNPDGSAATASFYFTSVYIGAWQAESPTFVKRSWHEALEQGHEVGVHTHSHSHGSMFAQGEWDSEIETCLDWLTKPFDANEPDTSPDDTKGIGATMEQIPGFRTPYLEYNDATLSSVQEHGFRYDCSIEEGWQPDHGGGEFNWPYTLDGGSPGHDILVEWGSKEPIEPHAGLWEMPAYPVVVPPDELAAEYGIPTGLRAKLQAAQSWFDVDSGKITGFDYNLWVSFNMTKEEVVATLKYTLDLRIAGNHAPFLFGTHSDYYSDKYTAPMNSTAAQRREAIEEFLDYALTKQEVRVKATSDVLDWMQAPSGI